MQRAFLYWSNQRIVVEATVAIFLVIVAASVSAWHLHSQFHVLYSLDQHHNDQAVISIIDEARQYVYFAVYTFTRSNIADALIRARRRGIVVRGITDADQALMPEEAAILTRLRAAGIAVETQKHRDGIMHVKALVTEHHYASGSYNWTTSATTVNDEILEIGGDDYLRRQYVSIIKKILLTNE